MGVGGWILMGLFWLLLIAVIVWVVMRLLPDRQNPKPSDPEPDDNTPDAILARRLARGEIDIPSYEALHDRLHRTTDVPSGKGLT